MGKGSLLCVCASLKWEVWGSWDRPWALAPRHAWGCPAEAWGSSEGCLCHCAPVTPESVPSWLSGLLAGGWLDRWLPPRWGFPVAPGTCSAPAVTPAPSKATCALCAPLGPCPASLSRLCGLLLTAALSTELASGCARYLLRAQGPSPREEALRALRGSSSRRGASLGAARGGASVSLSLQLPMRPQSDSSPCAPTGLGRCLPCPPSLPQRDLCPRPLLPFLLLPSSPAPSSFPPTEG